MTTKTITGLEMIRKELVEQATRTYQNVILVKLNMMFENYFFGSRQAMSSGCREPCPEFQAIWPLEMSHLDFTDLFGLNILESFTENKAVHMMKKTSTYVSC